MIKLFSKFPAQGWSASGGKTLFFLCVLASLAFSVFSFDKSDESQYVEAAVISCKGPADVMLVIDRSGTMGNNSKFLKTKAESTNFVDKLFSAIPESGPEGFNYHQIGLVAFNQLTATVNLNQNGNEIKNNINDPTGILGDDYPVGSRSTDTAIQQARLKLGTENGGNPFATKTMIILTDGAPSNLDTAKTQAALAKNNDIRIISIGLELDSIGDGTIADAKEFIKYASSSPSDCYYIYDSGEELENCTSISLDGLGVTLDGIYDSITAAVCDGSSPTISILRKPSGTLYSVDSLTITSEATDDVGFKNHEIMWSDDWSNSVQTVECANLTGTTINCDTGELGPFSASEIINYRSVVVDVNDNETNIDSPNPRGVTVANVTLDMPTLFGGGNLFRNRDNPINVVIYDPSGKADLDTFFITIDAPALAGIEIEKEIMTCSWVGSDRKCVYNFNPDCSWTDGITAGVANDINFNVYIYVDSSDMEVRQIISSENNLLVPYFEGKDWLGTCSDGKNNDCNYDTSSDPVIDLEEMLCDIIGPNIGVSRSPGGNIYDFESDGTTPMPVTINSMATDDNGIKQHTIYFKKNNESWQVAFDCNDTNIDGFCDEDASQSIANISTLIGSFTAGTRIDYYSVAIDYSGNNNSNGTTTEFFVVKSRECEGVGDLGNCEVTPGGKCCGGICNTAISNPDSYNTACAEEICGDAVITAEGVVSWQWGVNDAVNGISCSDDGDSDGCYAYGSFWDGGCEERVYTCNTGYCNPGITDRNEDHCIGGGLLTLNDYECVSNSCILDPAISVDNNICDESLDYLSIEASNSNDDFICGSSDATGDVLNNLTNTVSLKSVTYDENNISEQKIYWKKSTDASFSVNSYDISLCGDNILNPCDYSQDIGPFNIGDIIEFYASSIDDSPNQTESITAVYSFMVRDHECYYINSQADKGDKPSLTLCNSGNGRCCGGTCDSAVSTTSFDEGCYTDSCSGTDWVYVEDNESGSCGLAGTCFPYYTGCVGGNKCDSGYCNPDSTGIKIDSCSVNLFTNRGCLGLPESCGDIDNNIDCSVTEHESVPNYDSDSVACNCDCDNYDIEEKVYSSLSFDGVDDYVEIPNSASLNITGNEISCAAWVYIGDQSNDIGIIAKGPSSNQESYMLGIQNDEKPRMRVYTDSYAQAVASDPLSQNEWHHLVGTYDGAQIKIYVDGALANSVPKNGSIISSLDPAVIGRRVLSDSRFYNGRIDDVRIYNRALYPEEVVDQYNGVFADDTGLVGYWNLDEGTEKTINDISGNDNDGTMILSSIDGKIYGNAEWKTGKYGNAIDFDGVDDYVEIPNSASLNITGNEISCAAWVYIGDQSNDIGIIAKGPSSNQESYMLGIQNDEKPRMRVYTDSYAQAVASDPLSQNEWHHLVGTYDGAQIKIYVDGALANSVPKNGSIISSLDPAVIGRRVLSDSRFYNGRIDDVRIYNRALYPEEVVDQYNGVFADDTGLVGYWNLDEGVGDIVYHDSKNISPIWMKHYHGSVSGANGNVPENWQACTDLKDNDCDGTSDEYTGVISDCDGEVFGVSAIASAKDRDGVEVGNLFGADSSITIYDRDIRETANEFKIEASATDDFSIVQLIIEWTTDNWTTTKNEICNNTGSCEVCVEGGACGADHDNILSSSLSADNIFKFKVCAVDGSANNNQKCTTEYSIEILGYNAVPVITPLSVINPDFCLERLKYILKWEFVDDGDAQDNFEIQIKENDFSSTGNIIVNKSFPLSDLFYQINSDDFETGESIEHGEKEYYWRVKVTDDRESGYERTTEWEVGPAFVTPLYEYPQVDFIVIPDYSNPCLYETDYEGAADTCDWGENITFSSAGSVFVECADSNNEQCLTTMSAKCDVTNKACVSCVDDSQCAKFDVGGISYSCLAGVCEISGSCVTNDDCLAADIARCDTGLCVACDDDSQCAKFNAGNISSGLLGNVSSGSSNTLTDNSKSWLVDEWAGGAVKIVSGAGLDQIRSIISNTEEEVTVNSNWTIDPDSSSEYRIIKYFCNNEGSCENKEHRKWWFYDSVTYPDSRDPNPINNYIESEVNNRDVVFEISDIINNSCRKVKNIRLGGREYPKWNEVAPRN